jgi:predicted HTH transcriptional regulator
MKSDNLAERIQLGEDSTLELKRVATSGSRVTGPDRSGFADELAGMANASGGVVVLGVDDSTRDVVGIPLDSLDSVESWAHQVCNDSIDPPLDAAIGRLRLQGAQGVPVAVIRIDVPRSVFVHRSPGGYYRRVGSSKRVMTPEVLARLFQDRSETRAIRFDEMIVPRTRVTDIENSLVRRFLPAGSTGIEEYRRKLRITATDEDGTERLTVAGVLMCTTAPQTWLQHAQIQAVFYAGERTDVGYQLDARDIGGPLDAQVIEALHFVRRNMRISATKPMARIETPQYSVRAVFEALVNAVAHRDYSMPGAQIRLHMFPDRITLSVPGGLANTLTSDSMRLRQYSRNQLIVSLLARCAVSESAGIARTHMMERRGDGVPIILDESCELSGQVPEYTLLDDSELQLTIWGAPPPA